VGVAHAPPGRARPDPPRGYTAAPAAVSHHPPGRALPHL
jgi:hypothetical protein